MIRQLVWLGCGVLVAAGVLAAGVLAAGADEEAPPRLFEMRTYVCHEGRLGALHDRFRDHTTKLFEKHGMTNIGYWVPVEGPESKDTLVYILAYPNNEARAAAWKAFLADPDWQTARAESEKEGPIVKQVTSKFLTPADYSALQ